MRLSRTFMGAMIAMLITALAIVISGTSSNNNGGTASAASVYTAPSATSTASTEEAATTATTPVQPTTPAYPVVRFTYEKAWPLTAQIASVTESPNGFPGGGLVVSPHHTILMVQVNITSQTVGQNVPSPRFNLVCSDPGVQFGQSGLYGYDGGPGAAPDSSGSSINLGDGQSHAWDSEWEVPEGTNTAGVICQLEEPTDYAPVVQSLN